MHFRPTTNKGKIGMFVILGLVGFIFIVIFTVLLLLSRHDRAILLQPLQTFQHDGKQRSYLERAPEQLTDETAIVIGLHGFGSDARIMAYYSGLQNTLLTSDLLLYPRTVQPQSGQKSGWNAGFCCGSGWAQNVDDVGFIKSLIRSKKEEYNIPTAKVFIVGFSNGAFMAQRLAAEEPTLITAAASVSGTIGTTKSSLKPTLPVPILITHGAKDNRVSFDGGPGTDDIEFDWLSHAETVAAWQAINNTDAQTQEIVYADDGHSWHDWRTVNFWHKSPAGSQDIVDFFATVR